jgi:hypothetical protein
MIGPPIAGAVADVAGSGDYGLFAAGIFILLGSVTGYANQATRLLITLSLGQGCQMVYIIVCTKKANLSKF